jgi:hypothetical protein
MRQFITVNFKRVLHYAAAGIALITLRRVLAVIAGILLVAAVAAYSYIPSTPQYSLYRLEHAAGANNAAVFAKYYAVHSVKAASADAASPDGSDFSANVETDQTKLDAFKQKYYQPLSPLNAYTKTRVQKETINNPGALVYIEQPGKQKIVFRMIQQEKIWVIVDAAAL